jgi:cyanate lyase
MLSKQEAAQAVLAAKVRLGLTWSQIADAVGRPVAWTTAALLGQHPMPPDLAKAAGSLLDLDEDILVTLQLQPTRGALDNPVPTDPTIYRFYEVLQVYGPTIKELIHEEFGDGIMSAINFRLDVSRAPDPAGDRVIVTLDGKFLPYQWLCRTTGIDLVAKASTGTQRAWKFNYLQLRRGASAVPAEARRGLRLLRRAGPGGLGVCGLPRSSRPSAPVRQRPATGMSPARRSR